MPQSSPGMSFYNLRPWNASQDRAFEELSYQLLRDEVPHDSVAVRTGNPDGGVEWYANLPSGEQWGWQAKNVRGIDALLTGMNKSVLQAAAERPNLTRLTFVIPWNLSTGTAKGTRKSQRKKYEDRINTWQGTIPGAADIEFCLVQESDLLERLVKPQHRGRQWFWLARPSLGADWLEKSFIQQSEIAGEKYRPDLQVDLPIADDLKALGLSQITADTFATHRNRVLKEAKRRSTTLVDNEELTRLSEKVRAASQQVVSQLESYQQFSQIVDQFDSLETSTLACIDAISELMGATDSWRVTWKKLQKDSHQFGREPLDEVLYRSRELRSAMSHLHEWLTSSTAQALRRRLYFLSGSAGSGKTHLLLDAARAALDEGRPAVVLFGGQFGSSNLWGSVCDQLGLEPLGADVLLDAMDSIAEASGLDDRRFVIMIDALNETLLPRFWQTHLPVLRAAILQRPHLALAVSCRDTYLSVVDEGNERRYFENRTHPGFAGREVEATQTYFDHYGLETPRIPLLTPEFTVPLFLRFYCESLQDLGKTTTSIGHEGRVRIFERYLDSKVARVAHRTDPQAVSNFEIEHNKVQVRSALNVLLDGMANGNGDSLVTEEAKTSVAAALSGDRTSAIRIIGAFEDEGVLIREPRYLGDGQTREIIRVSFQAFSDFLLLRRRLEQCEQPLEERAFRDWLRNQARLGILEAATVLLPEAYGVELPDFLGLTRNDAEWKPVASHEEHRNTIRAQEIYRSFTESLPYRESTSISERTIDLLNEALASVLQPEELFRTLFLIAPQPENQLNADGLHRNLARMRMSRRDAWFGFAVYYEIWDETSPTARLARWAARGPYPSYDPRVVELATVPLVWLLSTPNRHMRDWVTKALVQLLHGHLGVMRALLERFWSVDDPYIVQRVMAIAYGSLMRGGVSDRDEARRVGEWVLSSVFARPMKADELMIDAARGIVEWSVTHGILPSSALDATKRPYGLKPPGNPLTRQRLNAKYGSSYLDKRPASESYASIWSSLIGMGDFGRYVVDSAMDGFLRYRHGQPVPKRKPRERRLIRKNWATFIRSLSDAQGVELQEAVVANSASTLLSSWLRDDGSSPNRLTKDQLELYESAWTSPPPIDDPHYPGERARRWIFMRTLSLGWTPQLFGARDSIIGHRDFGRSEHKAERWGKKYQWMAFHELLARVADNYQAAERYGEPQPYDGLQQLIGRREIDPSLPPIDFRTLEERSGASARTWHPPAVRLPQTLSPKLDFARFHGDAGRFVADRKSEPLPDRFVQFTDDSGRRWIVIDGFEVQTEPSDVDDKHLEQTLWVTSAFVDQHMASTDTPRLAEVWNEHWHEFSMRGHIDCCYAGEVGWSPRMCSNRMPEMWAVEASGTRVEIIDTTVNYMWEGNILDCSIGEPVSATMPSEFIQRRTELKFGVDGPSWIDESGRLVAIYRDKDQDNWRGWHGLYVRVDWLQEFMRTHALTLALFVKFERHLLHAQATYYYPHVNVWASATLGPSGTLVSAGAPRRVEGPTTD